MLTLVDARLRLSSNVDTQGGSTDNGLSRFRRKRIQYMQTIAIRDVRAPLLHQLAEEKKLAGITDNRILIGVFTPVDRDWLLHLLTQNRSRLLQSVRDGERELDMLHEPSEVRTLDDRLKEAADRDKMSEMSASDEGAGWGPLDMVQPLLHAFSTVRNLTSHQLQENPRSDARTIKIREVSASEIRAAADASQMLVVTDRRQLVGIIIPVNQQLVAYVIEKNLSRLQRSVAEGEREYQSGSARTLAEILSGATAGLGV
jgi:hypothetical protein